MKKFILILPILSLTFLGQIQGMERQKLPCKFTPQSHGPIIKYSFGLERELPHVYIPEDFVIRHRQEPRELKESARFDVEKFTEIGKLKEALENEDFETFNNILKSTSLDVNKIKWATRLTLFGEAINQALKNGNLEFIELLLQHGIDINRASYLNLTPLQMVVEQVALKPNIEHDEEFLLEFINLLLDKGAKIDRATLEFVLKKSTDSDFDESSFYKKVLEIFKNNMSGQEALIYLQASNQ